MPRAKPTGVNMVRPKSVMNSYAFFVKICREEHKKRYPDENVDFKEFVKKCAERWKLMTDKEKSKFYHMAELDRKRFTTEMATFNSNADGIKKKRTRRAKDPRAPKRSMSAFFWFAQDERPKVRAVNPSYAVGDIAKELGRRWADAKPSDKSIYEGRAEKDRERYVREKQEFQQKLKDEKNSNGVMVKPEPEKLPEIPEIPVEDSEEEEMEEEPLEDGDESEENL